MGLAINGYRTFLQPWMASGRVWFSECSVVDPPPRGSKDYTRHYRAYIESSCSLIKGGHLLSTVVDSGGPYPWSF
jgi:hypothetical protein